MLIIAVDYLVNCSFEIIAYFFGRRLMCQIKYFVFDGFQASVESQESVDVNLDMAQDSGAGGLGALQVTLCSVSFVFLR